MRAGLALRRSGSDRLAATERTRAWLVSHPETAWLGGILTLGFVLRLVWAIVAVRNPVGLHDPFTYSFYGEQIAIGHGYRLPDGQPTAYFPPGYPFALGFVFWLVHHTPVPESLPAAGAGFNIILGLATIALGYLLTKRLVNVRVARITGVILAVYPNFVFHAALMLTETYFTFLVMAALAVLLWNPWHRGLPSRTRLVIFGLLIGLSALVRTVAPPLLLLMLIPMRSAGVRWGPALRATLIATLAALVVILPWTARNADVMGKPIFISLDGGDELCIGHNPHASGAFSDKPPCDPPKSVLLLPKREQEIKRDEIHRHEAIHFAINHPLDEFVLIFKRGYYLFYHDYDGLIGVESFGEDQFIDRQTVLPLLKLLADASWFLVLGAWLIGARRFMDRRRPRHMMLLLSSGCMLALPLEVFGDPRFKYPAIPFMVMIGAVPLARLVARVRALPGPGTAATAGPPAHAPRSSGRSPS
jgi:hypothetical protein